MVNEWIAGISSKNLVIKRVVENCLAITRHDCPILANDSKEIKVISRIEISFPILDVNYDCRAYLRLATALRWKCLECVRGN